MDEDEFEDDIESRMEEKTEVRTVHRSIGMNRADVAIALLHPWKGLFAGLTGMVEHLQSLLSHESGAIDEKKEFKRFVREAQVEIERIR